MSVCIKRASAAVVAAPLAVASCSVDVAEAPDQAEHPAVFVVADQYEAGGKRFAGLEQLAGWVQSSGARGLVFHSCVAADTQPLLAAFERFENLYLDIKWSLPGEAGCAGVTAQSASKK